MVLEEMDLTSESVAAAADKMVLDEINRQIVQVAKEVNEVTEERIPSIDETMFREVFLPFFARDEDRKYPQVHLGTWIRGVAGNQFQKVHIVNKDHQVILTVPPMYDREAMKTINPRDRNLKGMYHVVRTTLDLSKRSTHEAERYFTFNSKGRVFKDDIKIRKLRHAIEWNKIFEYFGREAPYKEAPRLLEILLKQEGREDELEEFKGTKDGKVSKKDESFLGDDIDYELA